MYVKPLELECDGGASFKYNAYFTVHTNTRKISAIMIGCIWRTLSTASDTLCACAVLTKHTGLFSFFFFPRSFFHLHTTPSKGETWNGGGDKVLEACCSRLTSNQSAFHSFRLPTWLLHTHKYHDRGILPKIEFLYLRLLYF